ncbi:hypothetical protein [Bradyrhizobium sp.]|jgi:hypothetical protein|uniref:hypothetical protein n=1 Tax=Bradyrhizobium sp. TaxID=376 RepID=UPI002DDD09D7|nr:hypothetical protein [Bradyrhizobium sp.]HEV2160238.1 hypothetical protein [Bradyrhizobium sp.]
MTDAAIVADSAPVSDAPAGGAVINENAPGFNSPLGSQIPPDAQAKPDVPAKPASLDDSIDRAIAKSQEKQAAAAKTPEPKADAKADAKVEPKEPQARGEGGKFAAKEPVVDPKAAPAPKVAEPAKQSFTASDAPSRFSDDAKKEWATAPESVRRETERAIKELTDGFQKYKGAAERDGTLNEFHDMAKASGKELSGVVREYVNMENKLRQDPIGGLDMICQRMGLSLRDVAAHVMGQKPEQVASQQDATIRELRAELTAIKEQVGGVTQTLQQQSRDATLTEVNKFAADHPRFEELADAISEELKHGYSLAEAYSRAERLNPAPAAAAKEDPLAASSAAPEPPVQPDKGQKSINGAPSAGSTPAAKKRVPKSLDEALDRAFGQVG